MNASSAGRTGRGTRGVATAALLAAAAGLVVFGIDAGSSSAEEARAAATRTADDALRVEVAAAAGTLRRLLDAAEAGRVDAGPAAALPVELVEVAYRRPSAEASTPPAFDEADRLEFVEHKPAAALAAWRAAAAAEAPGSPLHAVAARNVARLLRATGDAAAADSLLAAELPSIEDGGREALLLRFDAARAGSDADRRALVEALLAGGFSAAAPDERLVVVERLGAERARTIGLAALSRILEAGGTEPRVVDVGGGRIAWHAGASEGIHRVATAARADLLGALLPSVAAGRAAPASPDAPSGVALPSPPFPPLALVPGRAAIAEVDARASEARMRRLVPAASAAILLVLGGALLVLDGRRRERLRRREDAFLLSVTHEIKTPIANVRLYAETIAAHGADDPARVPEFAAVIVAEADRLRLRVEEILAVAAGRAALVDERASFRPDAELHAVADEWRARFPARAIVVDAVEGAALPPARGTPALFRRAVAGLLDNAIKFAPDGPVRLGLSRREGVIELRVRDEGPGIPAADRERVFEPFVRLDDAIRRAVPGTGLGLALVRRCVEACGGAVRVEPVGPPGAVVRAEFPVASAPTGAPPLARAG